MASSRSAFRLRVLPATMLLCMLFLGIKIGDILDGTNRLQQVIAQPAMAAAEGDEKKPEAKEAADADSGKEPATAETGAKETAEKAPPVELPAGASMDKPQDAVTKPYNQIELDLLQSLAKRREEIEKWEQEVKLKENTLKATEERVEQKLADLKKLRGQMENLLAQYNEKEDAKIRSLVKIYETMKPVDAARIFEELDMPTLLMVVDKMSERKAAPVLAAMSSIKAKELTVQLAEQRRVTQPVAEDAAGQAAQ